MKVKELPGADTDVRESPGREKTAPAGCQVLAVTPLVASRSTRPSRTSWRPCWRLFFGMVKIKLGLHSQLHSLWVCVIRKLKIILCLMKRGATRRWWCCGRFEKAKNECLDEPNRADSVLTNGCVCSARFPTRFPARLVTRF